MNNRHLLLALALLVASCARTDRSEPDAPNQIIIAASFENEQPNASELNASELNASEIKSKTPSPTPTSTKSTATAFEAGDELGLFVVRSGQEIQSTNNLVNNAKLVVANDGSIKGQPDPIYYPTKTTTSLYSYYPYQSGHASADALDVHVGIRTDQTDLSEQKLSDLCFGSKLNITASSSAQAITFTHRFAQLTLNFTAFDEIKAVRLFNIKDSARLNIKTGVATLRDHTAEIVPHKNSATSYTAIIPAQTLTGACIAIDLKDNKTYTYNAVNPIALTQSATNTLNLTINEKGDITLNGTAEITAWGSNANSGTISESINNQITLMWLAPHAQFAAADKITLSTTDPLNVTRDIEIIPTVDPTSSPQYAVYKLNLSFKGATYPLKVTNIKIYAGATLLRDCISAAIVGSTISKTGVHTMGIHLSLYISPAEDWLNVSGYGANRVITVTTANNAQWKATATGAGLSVFPTSGKNGETAIIKWGGNAAVVISPTRSGSVTFTTDPNGAAYTVNTTQGGVIDRILINGIYWARWNVGATAPQDYGTQYTFDQAPAACASFGTGWRLPTTAEFGALFSNSPEGTVWADCPTGNYTSLSGVNGAWAGPGAKTADATTAIFFPAAGTGGNNIGLNGYCWSSSSWDSAEGYCLHILSSHLSPQYYSPKVFFFSVRCVQ